jgi:transcriptional regulator with XRE-family HTH domain
MATVVQFAQKLELVLKALSLSRGRLAAQLGVDKSLVGRWVSGAVSPSDHNLSSLTRLVAQSQPGFSMLDWDRDLAGLARVFGVEVAPVPGTEAARGSPNAFGLPLPMLETALSTTERRGGAYEGFWRSTRPSVMMAGRFFNDHGMIRIGADGLLNLKMGGAGLLFEGWLLPAEGQLFAILSDAVGLTPMFLVLNGTPMPKASTIDGIVMFAALNPTRTPSAHPILFERIGDLSGNAERDHAECEALIARDPLAAEGATPDYIRDYLVRDIGPEAAKTGGDLFLLAAQNRSRGGTLGGALTG